MRGEGFRAQRFLDFTASQSVRTLCAKVRTQQASFIIPQKSNTGTFWNFHGARRGVPPDRTRRIFQPATWQQVPRNGTRRFFLKE
jgi:hypothetical protein